MTEMAGVESYQDVNDDTEGAYRLRKRQKSFVRCVFVRRNKDALFHGMSLATLATVVR